jgi:hypothetical protein
MTSRIPPREASLPQDKSKLIELLDQYEKKISVETKLKSSAATLVRVHSDPKNKKLAEEELQGL